MELLIAGSVVSLVIIVVLQCISLEGFKGANADLTRQLKRRDGDLIEARMKNKELRDEINTFPLLYQKPPAVSLRTEKPSPRRRWHEQKPADPKPIDWGDDREKFTGTGD